MATADRRGQRRHRDRPGSARGDRVRRERRTTGRDRRQRPGRRRRPDADPRPDRASRCWECTSTSRGAARSRQRSTAPRRAGDARELARLERRRAQIDDRFDPRKALAATVRYLQFARATLRPGRPGGRVLPHGDRQPQQVLADYNGGAAVPYVQLYFDTAPDRHAAAFRLLAGFGDDSSLYYWRVLGAEQIMRAVPDRPQRADPAGRAADGRGLGRRRAAPARPVTPSFADPGALDDAYAARTRPAAARQRRSPRAGLRRLDGLAGAPPGRDPGPVPRAAAGGARSADRAGGPRARAVARTPRR